MAGLVGGRKSAGPGPEGPRGFDTPKVARATEPEAEAAQAFPRWLKAVVSVSFALSAFFVVGALFVSPTMGPSTGAVSEAEAEAAEAEAAAADLDTVRTEAMEQVSATFTAEDAENASDAAHEAAVKVLDHQVAMREAESDEAVVAEAEAMASLMQGSPEKAVAWYVPARDVTFEWTTFTPYIFVDEADAAGATPAPRVLWLAKSEDGKVLAWARGTFDLDMQSFRDVDYGMTEAGVSLLASDDGQTSTDATVDEIDYLRDYLEDMASDLDEVPPMPEEDRQQQMQTIMEDRKAAGL